MLILIVIHEDLKYYLKLLNIQGLAICFLLITRGGGVRKQPKHADVIYECSPTETTHEKRHIYSWVSTRFFSRNYIV